MSGRRKGAGGEGREGGGRVQSLYITTRKSRDFILLQVHVFSQYMNFFALYSISALYHDSSGPMVVKSVAFVLPNSSKSIKKMLYFHHST